MSKQIWSTILKEAECIVSEEPSLVSLIHETVINQPDLAHSLAFHLGGKFQDSTINSMSYNHLFIEILEAEPKIVESVIADLKAIRERDPATTSYIIPLLY